MSTRKKFEFPYIIEYIYENQTLVSSFENLPHALRHAADLINKNCKDIVIKKIHYVQQLETIFRVSNHVDSETH